jgi:hypothetical protein
MLCCLILYMQLLAKGQGLYEDSAAVSLVCVCTFHLVPTNMYLDFRYAL